MTANDPAGAVGTRSRHEHETTHPGNGHGHYRTDESAVRVDDQWNPSERRDRARWGPIWAGSLITVLVFIVLQSFFFALGWLDLGFDAGASNVAASTVSGVLALVSFFIGGLAAAAFAMWRGTQNGVEQGISVWALTNVSIIILALLGGGALLGNLGSLVSQLGTLQQAQAANVPMSQAIDSARTTAGATSLYLGATALFAALGGIAGSKIWPSKRSGENADDR